MSKNILISAAAALVLLTLSGCFFNSERPQIAFYDLQLPAKVQEQCKFRVMLVSNSTPSRTFMLYRQKNNQILQDELNCWVQLPERMLMRYIAMAYPWGKNSCRNAVEAQLTITAFEFNAADNEAVLAFNYQLNKDLTNRTGSVMVREKVKAATPEEFAAAMSRAAEKACKELATATAELK